MTTPDAVIYDLEELTAYRDGASSLAYDPLKAGGTLYVDYDEAHEPIRIRMGRTYEGRPAVVCNECLRVTLDSDDEDWTCRNCGADDGTYETSEPLTCTEGVGPCLLAGSDWCVCHEVRERPTD